MMDLLEQGCLCVWEGVWSSESSGLLMTDPWESVGWRGWLRGWLLEYLVCSQSADMDLKDEVSLAGQIDSASNFPHEGPN